MCAKTRKLKTKRGKRNKKSTGSLFSILLVFVILSVIAAAVAYFFYDIGKTKSKAPVKTPSVSIQKAETKNKTNPIRKKGVLDGSWVSTSDGRILEIHGTSFSLELPSVSNHQLTKGKITVTGNTASIVYTDTENKCAQKAGIYTFTVHKGSVLFRAKHDNCPGRKQIFSTTWDKF